MREALREARRLPLILRCTVTGFHPPDSAKFGVTEPFARFSVRRKPPPTDSNGHFPAVGSGGLLLALPKSF